MSGANAWHQRGRRQASTAAPLFFYGAGAGEIKLIDIGTVLDRKIAAAMAAGSSGPLGYTVNRLNIIHEALKAQRASGLLTDEEYAKEAGGLLNATTLARMQCKK